MRTWGRIGQVNGTGGTWVQVATDADGYNDQLYLTSLTQCLRLNLGESPFWADRGIPAHQSVITQVAPDFYAAYTQQLYSQYFASLTIQRVSGKTPAYRVNIVCHSGAALSTTVAM